jgi:hypothetical protein
MADRRSRRDRYQVQLDYAFDRLLGSKLQQVFCATSDDRTQHRAGAGIVPEMRLRDVPYIDPVERS